MGGQAGIRGYLLQTLISVLDSLEDDTWTAIQLEPGQDQEKADVIWFRPQGSQAVQVRHSTNQINRALATKWAAEFENGCRADEYVLRIAGSVTAELTQGVQLGNVKLAAPEPLVIDRLLECGAHKLDRFFDRNGISSVPAFAREIVLQAMTARFASYSTSGQRVERADFERQLREWIVALYPNAMNEAALELKMHYDKRLEEHRLELAQRLELFRQDQARVTALHGRRAGAAARVWRRMRRAEDLLRPVVRRTRSSDDPPKVDQLNAALTACNELVDTWDSVAVFLPELDDAIEEVIEMLREIVFCYRLSETVDFGPREGHKHFEKAHDLLHKRTPELRKRIREIMIDLLGLGDNVARSGQARAAHTSPREE